MKALPDKVIIYDNNCPMCSLYTSGFVKWGLLEKQNRIAFADLDSAPVTCELDLNRARHEIPLIDLKGGKTIYGLDALLFIMGSKIPVINPIFKLKPIHSFSACLYDIVSYNRRIIVPAHIPFEKKDFAPDVSTKHRLLFIGISFLLSGLLVYSFAHSLNEHLYIPEASLQILCIAIAGWLVQMLIGLAFIKADKLDYSGHLAVVILMGTLVLLPGMIADAVTGYQFIAFPVTGILLSALIMLWQHFIRVSHLRLNQTLTLSWFLLLAATIAFCIFLFYFNN